MEEHKYLLNIVCVYSCFSYTACKVYALYYTHTCSLSGSTIFFHIISWTAQRLEKKLLNKNVCFEFLYNFYLKHFSF